MGFEGWGHFVFRHAKLVLAVILVITAGLISQLPKITIDTSSESFTEGYSRNNILTILLLGMDASPGYRISEWHETISKYNR